MECDLDFLGLIVFRNEMRDDSPATIAKLRVSCVVRTGCGWQPFATPAAHHVRKVLACGARLSHAGKHTPFQDGNIRTVMITGDSPQCGAYIARQCGMVPPDAKLILGEYDGKQGTVVWSEITSGGASDQPPVSTNELMAKVRGCLRRRRGGWVRRTHNTRKFNHNANHTPTQHAADLESGALELAVTGSAFKMLERACRASPLLYFIRIFARTKPEGKVRR